MNVQKLETIMVCVRAYPDKPRCSYKNGSTECTQPVRLYGVCEDHWDEMIDEKVDHLLGDGSPKDQIRRIAENMVRKAPHNFLP